MTDRTTETTRLSDCPFCGSSALEEDRCGQSFFNICCTSCKAIGPDGSSVDVAMRLWNRREGATDNG